MVDAEEVAGVEIVLLWAVPTVSAELASWPMRSRESLGRTPSRRGSGRAAAAAVGGSAVEDWGPVILQRQVLQSCSDPGFGASASVHRQSDSVRDGVLLVLSSVVHIDRYPQCSALLLAGSRGVAVH